ncbi:MAG: hypothetical protein ACRCSQ_05290 [Bacteroidales bacterium]
MSKVFVFFIFHSAGSLNHCILSNRCAKAEDAIPKATIAVVINLFFIYK